MIIFYLLLVFCGGNYNVFICCFCFIVVIIIIIIIIIIITIIVIVIVIITIAQINMFRSNFWATSIKNLSNRTC